MGRLAQTLGITIAPTDYLLLQTNTSRGGITAQTQFPLPQDQAKIENSHPAK